MNEMITTVCGNVVAAPVRHEGKFGPFVTFRVAQTESKPNRAGNFEDLHTNYFDVVAFNSLAANAHAALSKGDPVIVHGVWRIRQYEDKLGNPREASTLRARTIGHNLCRGRSTFTRLGRVAEEDPMQDPAVTSTLNESRERELADGGTVNVHTGEYFESADHADPADHADHADPSDEPSVEPADAAEAPVDEAAPTEEATAGDRQPYELVANLAD